MKLKYIFTALMIIMLCIPMALATRSDFKSELSPFGNALSVYGDQNCGLFDAPHSGGVYEPTGASKTVTCGVDPGNALIDIYVIRADGSQFPYMEKQNPVTFQSETTKYKWECYICEQELPTSTGNTLTTCNSNSDCSQYGDSYWCDGGACHRTVVTADDIQTSEDIVDVVTTTTSDNFGDDTPSTTGPKLNFKDINIQVSGNQIITKYLVKNVGITMTDSYVLETQIRPQGSSPLAVVSEQKVCDPDYPENVNVDFKLDAGEEVLIELSSVVSDGDYDVYGILVDKCYAESPVGNTKIEPLGAGVKLDSVIVGVGFRNSISGDLDDIFKFSKNTLLYTLIGVFLILLIYKKKILKMLKK